MPRSIGSIEVIVDTDTGRLVAQLRRAGKLGGKAAKKEIEDELDDLEVKLENTTAEGKKAGQLLARQIEAAVEGIEVGIDLKQAKLTMQRFEQEEEAREIAKSVVLNEHDLAEINANIARAREQAEANEWQIDIDMRTALAEAELEAEEFARHERLIEFGIDIDSERAMAQLEADILGFEATHPDAVIRAQIETELNQAKVRFDLAALNAMVENTDFDANVEVRVDKASKAAADALIEKNMSETGDKAGQQFSKNFGDSFLSGDDTKLAIAAILSMGDALSSGLSGAVAAGTSVVSSAISSVGAAAGAATPIVAAFAGGIGAVITGSQGFGDAMKAITEEFELASAEGRRFNAHTKAMREALNKLSPQARLTAQAFGDIRDELRDVRLDVQERLFEGFSSVVRDLGRTVLPDVGDALGTLAHEFNIFGKDLADVAKGIDFSDLAEDLAPALDDAFDAGTALADTLGPFLEAAAPAAEELAEMIERGAEGLRDWVKANPDEITQFLEDGLVSLQLWVDVLGSTGDLLATIFDAGTESGNTFVASLNNMIERWDQFLESTQGQDALAEFFQTGRDAMEDLKPLLDGLKEAFDVLVTPETSGRFGELTESIGAALPSLAELISLMGELQLAAGFADLLSALRPVFELIQLIPDDLMKFAGVAIVVSKSLNTVIGGLKGIGLASKALTFSNPYILGIAAAVTVAVAAFDAFGGKSAEAEATTKSLAGSLGDTVDALIAAGEAGDEASLGVDAFNKALQETGTDFDSDKLTTAFGVINSGAGAAELGIEDMRQVLIDVGRDPVKALSALAEGFGLPAEEARILGERVNETNDNFADGSTQLAGFRDELQKISDRTGISVDSLINLTRQLEEVQDQEENTGKGAEQMMQQFLNQAAGASEAERAALAQAQAAQTAGDVAAGVTPLYDEYVRILGATAFAADDAANSEGMLAGVYRDSEQARLDANAAVAEREDALAKENAAAMDAWEAEMDLADAVRDGAGEAAAAAGFSEDLADQFVALGDAAHDAADRADALKASIDLLISPAATVEQSFSDLQEAVDEFDIIIQGGQEAIDLRIEAEELLTEANEKGAEAAKEAGDADVEASRHRTRAAELLAQAAREDAEGEHDRADATRDRAAAESEAADSAHERAGTTLEAAAAALTDRDAALAQADALEAAAHSLDLNTEAGRNNAAFLRDQAATTLDWAVGMLAAGESADVVTAKVNTSRETLEQQAVGFGLSGDEADAYINTLLGTPDLLTTLIETPGLADALLNVDDLNVLYDSTGEPVYTEFAALGLTEAQANSEDFKTLLEQLDLIKATPEIDTSQATIAKEDVHGIEEALGILDATQAYPGTELEGDAAEDTANLQDDIDDLDNSSASPRVTVQNIDPSITKVNQLDRAIRSLTSKTVTINVVQRVTGQALPGGTRLTGGMTGEIITGPTVREVGERGYREAIIPLDLPLSRVDPSVRQLAELIRGGSNAPVASAPGKTVVNHLNITPISADPEAVATKIINRAAAMAANL